jgi:hypothetical protein
MLTQRSTTKNKFHHKRLGQSQRAEQNPRPSASDRETLVIPCTVLIKRNEQDGKTATVGSSRVYDARSCAEQRKRMKAAVVMVFLACGTGATCSTVENGSRPS